MTSYQLQLNMKSWQPQPRVGWTPPLTWEPLPSGLRAPLMEYWRQSQIQHANVYDPEFPAIASLPARLLEQIQRRNEEAELKFLNCDNPQLAEAQKVLAQQWDKQHPNTVCPDWIQDLLEAHQARQLQVVGKCKLSDWCWQPAVRQIQTEHRQRASRRIPRKAKRRRSRRRSRSPRHLYQPVYDDCQWPKPTPSRWRAVWADPPALMKCPHLNKNSHRIRPFVLQQFLDMWQSLQPGGTWTVRIFSITSVFMQQLLFVLRLSFDRIQIVEKRPRSRLAPPGNTLRHLVASGFRVNRSSSRKKSSPGRIWFVQVLEWIGHIQTQYRLKRCDLGQLWCQQFAKDFDVVMQAHQQQVAEHAWAFAQHYQETLLAWQTWS